MKKFYLLFLLPLCFVSCKKYEDGPAISFRSVEKRLAGKWRLTDILYNDKDISVAYYASHFDLYPYNIYSDWSHQTFISITHNDNVIIASSILSLNKRKTIMSFAMVTQDYYGDIGNAIFTIIPPLETQNEWKILRLKNDEFWIRTNFDSNNYELHFDLITDFNDY
jgi:hypothetical protein